MSKINIFITVDTEPSIGGAFGNPHLKPVGNEKRIFGRIGDKCYGIPLIMDIAGAFNIPVTFFMEALNKHYFGEEEGRKVCESILHRGHDIQLHLHPNYLNFTLETPQQRSFSDLIGTYPLEKQLEFIREGTEILAQNGVSRPIAFRAGCFGANEDTLRALKAGGFLIDSSYNRSYLGNPCLLKENGINDLAYLEGIFEFPITNFIECTKLRARRFKPLDINGVSSQEIKSVCNQAKVCGPRNITIVLHSFSFIKAYDVQYNKLRPRCHVIRRFENVCRFLKENADDFAVKTFGSLKREELTQMALQPIHSFPRVPGMVSVKRGFEQLRDNLF